MAKFFFDIYKTVAAAQTLLYAGQSSNVVQNIIIESVFTEKQRKIAPLLTEESIRERANTIQVKVLVKQVKEELSAFVSEFDNNRIAEIDRLYSRFTALTAFVGFDYHFLLKKFDSSLPERNFNYTPHFEAIRGEYVVDDLKDFISVAWPLPMDSAWADTFAIIKTYREVEPVAPGAWNKLMSRIQDLKNSRILEKIIQHSSKDPVYNVSYTTGSEHIAAPYIEKLKTQTELVLNKLQQERQNNKVNDLLMKLFEATEIVRLRNYSERGNAVFQQKMISGYLYYDPLNYMKAFLIDYFKKDIREVSELVLVRGQWSTATLANEMSEAYHSLLETSNKITAFDESLAEDSDLGVKLKTLTMRMDRDKEAGNILRSQLKDINERALNFLTNGSQNLVVYARNLKNILEDKEKPHPEIIINWKELDHYSEEPFKDRGVAVYKQIYLFITLMQMFLKPSSGQ
ncbi:MAG: DUF5312 family protein [Spirochaetaceae bacterium]|nr:DUF5312 family protein [Spirochaetaceae bacterium]